MTSFYDNYDYYKKMLELQEKLRKSEEERIRLEERFKILIQESRNRHDACINRLRLRYIEFLEEQRTRDERNHKLLEALDRVDNSLALMTAKTDRLNVLKKQYEAYLRRIYTVPSPSGSIIDDGNVMSQSEDRYPKRDVTGEQIHFSSEVGNTVPFHMLRSNGPKNRLYFPSTVKLTKSARNIHYNYCQRNIVQPRALNQQVNGQNILPSYPLISHNGDSIEQLPDQNLVSTSFQRRQYVQIGGNLHIPYVSSGRSGSLSQQTVPHFDLNETLPERTETAQNMSHFVIPERADSSTSQYKFLDVSQNRFAFMTPRYFHLSSAVQPHRQENHKTLINDMQTRTKSGQEFGEISPMKYLYKNNPIKSSNFLKHISPNCFDYSWRKFDHFKSKKKSVSDTCVRSLATSDVNNMIKRYKRFIPKTSISLSMDPSQAIAKEDECRTAMIVENELDRYIDKIRKLQCDLDAQSLEEIDKEKNMNVNTLNDTLSDNENFRIPIEGKSKENLPKEVEKVLALADDLVSRTVDLNVINSTKEGLTNEDRNYAEVVETAQSDIPIPERSYTAFSITRNRPETLAMLAKDEISNDIKLHVPKLDSHRYIGKTGKENFNSQRQLPETEKDEQQVVFAVSLDDKITEQDTKISKEIQKEEYNENDNICIAAESNLDQYLFNTVEELEPWNLDLLQKRIKEIGLTCETENQFNDEKGFVVDTLKLNQDDVKQTEPLNKIKTLESRNDRKDTSEDTHLNGSKDESKQNIEYLESNKVFTNKNEMEVNEASALQKVEYKNESCTDTESVTQNIESAKVQVDEQNEFNNEQGQECEKIDFVLDANENNEQEMTIPSDEYNNQDYYENFNQIENYVQNYETECADLNEKYSYDQNASYEDNENNDYNKNVSYEANQEQNYDSNTSYEINQDENCNSNVLRDDIRQDENYNSNESHETNQEHNYEGTVVYENNQNQEYQEYVNQEYVQRLDEQYEEYVGEQYDSENQYEYDPNVQYQKNMNEQYDQQYDSRGVSDTNVNQSLAYSDYDPNQVIEEEEDKQNQEYEELQKESKSQAAEEKVVDLVQDKNERSSFENGMQKKKDANKSLLDSDTDSTIERNISNTESDFDFN
ncbi:PREDICTED: protein PFC0760c-like [Eufriesea mexicana]|uniref:protein PFC0760c-like n=1 Tax=Eufriesea mexicana TaxID=516756 RepID=UPI00083C013F|nr:PREDICTED: protein PFC0760c-like [Eufriesea mexicana]